MSKGTFSALFVAALCAHAGTAWAQDDAALQESGEVELSTSSSDIGGGGGGGGGGGAVGPLRINAGLHFGFGGQTHLEAGGTDFDVDMDPTIGLQAGADYVLMDFFSIGGELRLAFPKADGADDRDMFFDLDVKPKGRYAFGNIPLEVYGTLPLGLTVYNPDDDAGIDGGAGFNLGFGAGATYFVTDNIGINTEMLGIIRWYGAEDAAGNDVDLRTGQFTWFFNAVYAL